MKPTKKSNMSALRKKLRSMHLLSGATLEDVSGISGVSASQISEFETGAAGMRGDKLRAVEKALRRLMRARARRIGQVLAAEQAKSSVQKAPRRQTLADALQSALLKRVGNTTPEAGSSAEGGRANQ